MWGSPFRLPPDFCPALARAENACDPSQNRKCRRHHITRSSIGRRCRPQGAGSSAGRVRSQAKPATSPNGFRGSSFRRGGLPGAAVQFFIRAYGTQKRIGWRSPLRIGTLISRRRSPRIGASTPSPSFGCLPKPSETTVEKTRRDDMVHRAVVGAVNGLVHELMVERKRVPGEVLFEADRLECLVFPRLRPEFRRVRTSRVFKLLVGFGDRGSLVRRAVLVSYRIAWLR
jgi:hypothetical protein